MRILETGEGWTVESDDGRHPIAIDDTPYFEERSALVAAIERRGMYVWSTNDLWREPEPSAELLADRDAEWEAADPGYGAPATEDPPIDPGAQPDNPAPVSPEPEKASPKTKATVVDADSLPKRRGRPPVYSPDEARERRREQAKKYHANRSEEQKEAARVRARNWRARNPEKVKEARANSIEKRAVRYKEDPEFRDNVNEYQRGYKREKRTEPVESS